MTEPIRVGDVVHGHLFGYFGRDHYDCARVEAIGRDWMVLRTFEGRPVVGTGGNDMQADVAQESGRVDSYGHSISCPDWRS